MPLLGICVGMVVAGLLGRSGDVVPSGLTVEDRVLVARRLGEIETSLALERYERRALAEEFASVKSLLTMLRTPHSGEDYGSPDAQRERVAASPSDAARNPFAWPLPDVASVGRPRSREEFEQFVRQQQFDRLVAAGIDPERVYQIMRREETLEMEVLRARHAATRSGATPEEAATITPLALLRSELGDTDYAKYLDARGRPSSINIREVMKGSPAETAGLQPGDEIVAYNGQRVFNMDELDELTFQPTSGSTMPLQVIRDGQSLQIYVPPGPIGVRGDRP